MRAGFWRWRLADAPAWHGLLARASVARTVLSVHVLGHDGPSHWVLGRDAQATSRLRRRDADATRYDFLNSLNDLTVWRNHFAVSVGV
ncbi:MAG: hypothetical protein NZ874_05300 [Fimbriimonadales bacterium]|nr:hypothetical protein [Fimbriimonadales bacterium]